MEAFTVIQEGLKSHQLGNSKRGKQGLGTENTVGHFRNLRFYPKSERNPLKGFNNGMTDLF